MRSLLIGSICLLAAFRNGSAEDFVPADATATEQVKAAVERLNDPDFQQRESAVANLYSMGLNSIIPLQDAANSPTCEVSVRAFDVLQRLYRDDDEQTFEAVEKVFRHLSRADNLAVAARAERAFENGSETRQVRAIAQFERLGGIINFSERSGERRPRIELIMLGQDWVGGDAGLQLLSRIEDIRNARTSLYLIRGATKVSNDALVSLQAELPFMEIQIRGPARLGIRSSEREEGCVISEVDEKSAAEAAGLRKGDLVIRIDGQPVDSFRDLIDIVQFKNPGERIPILYRRGAETREAIAELLPWPRAKYPKPEP